MLWVVACTAFFGFFRLGELLLDAQTAFNPAIHLAWGNIGVNNPAHPSMTCVRLKQSKTDRFRMGVKIILGHTGSVLCPVAALLGYIARRGDCPGPFFLDSAVKPLVKPRFVVEARSILIALEVPQDQYVGHSFWIKAATSTTLVGVENSTIQLLGQWQSGAFLRYVRTPAEQLAKLSVVLAPPNRNHPQ